MYDHHTVADVEIGDRRALLVPVQRDLAGDTGQEHVVANQCGGAAGKRLCQRRQPPRNGGRRVGRA